MDLNEDGHGDILSGSYSRTGSKEGMAGLFQVFYGKPAGEFAKAEALNGTDGKPLVIPIKDKSEQTLNICTRPTAVDWDDDGDLDLVVGNFKGTFYVFSGEGKGKFDPVPEALETQDGAPLQIGGAHSDPAVVDWDGDGDLDIVSGSSRGGVQWAENLGENGMTGFKALVEAGLRKDYGSILRQEELTGPTQSTRVWVADVDDDGKLDLLVGDSVTLISPANGLTAGVFRQKHEAWMEQIQESSRQYRELGSGTAEGKAAYQKYRQLYTEKEKFMDERRTGFVWLYRQK